MARGTINILVIASNLTINHWVNKLLEFKQKITPKHSLYTEPETVKTEVHMCICEGMVYFLFISDQLG